MTPEETAAEPVKTDGIPYLGFFLGADIYGIPLSRLRAVARLTQIRHVPGAAGHIAGLVNVRGEIMCALDLRAILGVTGEAAAEPGFLIALRDFEQPLGLVVDAIADIFPIDQAAIDGPPASWPAGHAAYFVGLSSVRLGQIGLLDVDRVVSG